MNEPILTLHAIEARYFDVPVLQSVDLEVKPGEAVGIVGENGAGKSTLMKLIGGVHRPASGHMLLDGQPYDPHSPHHALAVGVAMVHQELNLFPNLTVAENLFLGNLGAIGSRFWINRRQLREEAVAVLGRVGLAVSPDTPLRRLSPGQRQLVEIAKGIANRARVLMLDEPTTSLTDYEAEHLFELLEDLKRQGVALIYVSHALGHVRRLCDRLVVLRDGDVQASGATGDFSVERLISLMVGRQIHQVFPARTSYKMGGKLLTVEQLTQPGVLRNVSFELHRGEVLGLSGLMGSGRSELARTLFGLDPYASGRVLLNGKQLQRNPREAIKQGMAFVTESRREDGLMLEASIEENVLLASHDKLSRGPLGWLKRREGREAVEAVVQPLDLRNRSLTNQPVAKLSGGNQQKVVLAKWLLADPRLLILDEPTRGIDVGAKVEIYQLINALSQNGVGVLVISSEVEELMGLCDRILVMAEGEVRFEALRADFDRERLLRESFGEARIA